MQSLRVFRPVRFLIQTTRQNRRHLHSSPVHNGGSPLFQLGALANSRENRFLQKHSGLSQINHSPPLEMIRSSEVDPFARADNPPSPFSSMISPPPLVTPTATHKPTSRQRKPIVKNPSRRSIAMISLSDAKALNIGKKLMDEQAKEVLRWKRLLRKRDLKLPQIKDADILRAENRRLVLENDDRTLQMLWLALLVIVAGWMVASEKSKRNRASSREAERLQNIPTNSFGMETQGTTPHISELLREPLPEASRFDEIKKMPVDTRTQSVRPVAAQPQATVPVLEQPQTRNWRSWFWGA